MNIINFRAKSNQPYSTVKVNIVTDANGKIIEDDNGKPISERRSNKERRFNTIPRREEVRWEPSRNQRRQLVDRRKENLTWTENRG